jgi:hypothetical protein
MIESMSPMPSDPMLSTFGANTRVEKESAGRCSTEEVSRAPMNRRMAQTTRLRGKNVSPPAADPYLSSALPTTTSFSGAASSNVCSPAIMRASLLSAVPTKWA